MTDFRSLRIIHHLGTDLFLAHALFFREFEWVGDNLDKLRDRVAKSTGAVLEALPSAMVHRRIVPGDPEWREFFIELDPPRKSEAWLSPARLRFDAVCWKHGDVAKVAFVPALNIEIIVGPNDDFDARVHDDIRFALMRQKRLEGLASLAGVQRIDSLRIEPFSVEVKLPTPKQIAMAEERGEPKESVLRTVATILDDHQPPHRHAYEIDRTTAQVVETLTRKRARSVLLVGPSGVGKSACVYDLARRRRELGLKSTPIYALSGSRLVAGMSGYGMWQERCEQLWKEATKARAILHLGNLVELMDVGKSEGNHQGIASFLRPYIGRGDFRVIAECTPEQIPLIETEDPHLLDAFVTVEMTEPDAETAKSILLHVALGPSLGSALKSREKSREKSRDEGRETGKPPPPSSAATDAQGVPIEIEALETLDRLHRRYATYSAFPGRPVRFLRHLLEDRDPATTLVSADVIAAFSRETGLPRVLLDPAERLDLPATHEWFASRVIGQTTAVDLIVDLLAMVKAVLARPKKPIASLMFIGPTGVGKTEMAKALAEFLFHDRQRMTRFDMSEYADPLAVQRLIGGAFGSEGILTARVRENPFAVILFDEVEKAHPAFFDLMLQVLGEGRLTDAGGRIADFCNSVIIMTSNLGAESFRQGAIGFSDGADTERHAAAHFMNEVRKFVRPELFNRLDRIVPFMPLSTTTAHHITTRELDLVCRRDGIRYRGVATSIAQTVSEHLTRVGFDPRYGARPLKRAIDRHLLVPLAEQLNDYSANTPLDAAVTTKPNPNAPNADADGANEGTIAVKVGARLNERGRPISAADAIEAATRQSEGAAELRRFMQRLMRSASVREVENELFRLQRLEERLLRKVQRRAVDSSAVAALPELKKKWSKITALRETIVALEERALLSLYGDEPADPTVIAETTKTASAEFEKLLLDLYAQQFAHPDTVTMAIFGNDPTKTVLLASSYFSYVANLGGQTGVYRFVLAKDRKPGKKNVTIGVVQNPLRLFATVPDDTLGVLLRISAPLAFPRFAPEAGLHVFRAEKATMMCLVEITEKPPEKYEPPANIERKGTIGQQERRRHYDLVMQVLDDPAVRARLDYASGKFDDALRETIERRLIRDAYGVLPK